MSAADISLSTVTSFEISLKIYPNQSKQKHCKQDKDGQSVLWPHGSWMLLGYAGIAAFTCFHLFSQCVHLFFHLAPCQSSRSLPFPPPPPKLGLPTRWARQERPTVGSQLRAAASVLFPAALVRSRRAGANRSVGSDTGVQRNCSTGVPSDINRVFWGLVRLASLKGS